MLFHGHTGVVPSAHPPSAGDGGRLGRLCGYATHHRPLPKQPVNATIIHEYGCPILSEGKGGGRVCPGPLGPPPLLCKDGAPGVPRLHLSMSPTSSANALKAGLVCVCRCPSLTSSSTGSSTFAADSRRPLSDPHISSASRRTSPVALGCSTGAGDTVSHLMFSGSTSLQSPQSPRDPIHGILHSRPP